MRGTAHINVWRVVLVLSVMHVMHVTAMGVTASADDSSSASTVEAARGITGSITVTHEGPPLRAKPDQDLVAPLLVRVTETAHNRYRIDFIGAVAGTFDLRTLIEHRDGTPASELRPLPVRVVSELPAGHGTDLFGDQRTQSGIDSHYRLIIATIGVAWLAVPAAVLVRRALRNRPAPAAPPPAPVPTFADRLRPLVEAAMSQGLSVQEQARLELLLFMFWRERRDFGSMTPAEAISRLRVDPEAGVLLLAVERWLHARGNGASRPAEDLSRLLDPYRIVASPDVQRLAESVP